MKKKVSAGGTVAIVIGILAGLVFLLAIVLNWVRSEEYSLERAKGYPSIGSCRIPTTMLVGSSGSSKPVLLLHSLADTVRLSEYYDKADLGVEDLPWKIEPFALMAEGVVDSVSCDLLLSRANSAYVVVRLGDQLPHGRIDFRKVGYINRGLIACNMLESDGDL